MAAFFRASLGIRTGRPKLLTAMNISASRLDCGTDSGDPVRETLPSSPGFRFPYRNSGCRCNPPNLQRCRSSLPWAVSHPSVCGYPQAALSRLQAPVPECVDDLRILNHLIQNRIAHIHTMLANGRENFIKHPTLSPHRLHRRRSCLPPVTRGSNQTPGSQTHPSSTSTVRYDCPNRCHGSSD